MRFWIRRYLPSEIAGSIGALAGAAIAFGLTGSLIVAAIAGTVAESVGFYGVAGARGYAEQRRVTSGRRRSVIRATWLSVVEFGPAELIDTLLVRPGLLWLVPVLLGDPLAGWIFGKIAADILFYLVAAAGYRLGRRLDRQPPAAILDDTVLTRDVRAERLLGLRDSLAGFDLGAEVALHGTPLLLLDPAQVAARYRRLTGALPFVDFHYAVKALSHPAVIDTLSAAGAFFDIASDAEFDLLASRGICVDRIIDTQPVKTPAEITRAYVLGIRTFVVDSAGELAKFRNVPSDVSLLIRLSYPNPGAKSDLSSKFGVSAEEAEVLLSQATAQGNHIAGFTFHVGSQLDSIRAFRHAVEATLALMDRLERQWGVRFDTLDIGGGFPVGYRTDVAGIEEIADAIRPLLEPRAGRLRIIAEPGRILVADAATLVTRVVGSRERDGEPWLFIDDGVYGTYSNVTAENAHPVIVAAYELDNETELVPTTLAGPTCDSADVVARHYPLPRLHDGDVLLSPAMGAYTAVTATGFNGRRPTRVVLRGSGSETGLELVPALAATR